MCWSAPVSLATFLTSLGLCVYLWRRHAPQSNDRALAVFIFWFALMQLFEFFMWTNMHGHALTSKLALLAIQLQPAVLVAALYYWHPEFYPQVWEKAVMALVGGWSLVKTAASAQSAFFTPRIAQQNWLSVKGPHCHLSWWFVRHYQALPQLARTDNVYVGLLLTALAFIKPAQYGLLYFGFGCVAVALTLILYGFHEFGSVWCWISNLMGLGVIFL